MKEEMQETLIKQTRDARQLESEGQFNPDSSHPTSLPLSLTKRILARLFNSPFFLLLLFLLLVNRQPILRARRCDTSKDYPLFPASRFDPLERAREEVTRGQVPGSRREVGEPLVGHVNFGDVDESRHVGAQKLSLRFASGYG